MKAAAFGAAILLVLAGGCGGRSRVYQDPNMDFGALQRVAVLPFGNLTRDQAASDRVRDVFSNALLATNAVYVVPPGDVTRALSRVGVANPATPTSEEVVKLGEQLKVQAVFVGVVREYGEVRAGASTTGNIISLGLQVIETASGKVVWSGTTTKGGVSLGARLFGGSGDPLNIVTEQAVDDLLNQLFR